MINLEIHGRLGNQLFQYAYARKLMKDTNQPLTISFQRFIKESKGSRQGGWENSLSYFNVAPHVIYEGKTNFFFSSIRSRKDKVIWLLYVLCSKLSKRISVIKRLTNVLERKLSNNNFLFESFASFSSTKIHKKQDLFLKGFFENESYFSEISNILRSEIIPLNISEYTQKLITQMKNENSVCISIRTYNEIKHNPQWYAKYNICSEEYYKKAIHFIKAHVDNPHFYIFSDDIQWVKANYELNLINVEWCYGFDNSADSLYAMSQCKHFVISNSTYSWWGQFLSPIKNKTVVCPSIWNRITPNSPLIHHDNWILI